MPGFFSFAALDLAHGVNGAEFIRAEAIGSDQSKMIEPTVVVLIRRKIECVTVAIAHIASVGFAGENCGVFTDAIRALKLPAEDAHEISPCGLRHGQGVCGEWQH